MKHSKLKRLIAGCSAFVVLSSAIPFSETNVSVFRAIAESSQDETTEDYFVASSNIAFDLTGGSISDASFVTADGICSLKNGASPAVIPAPTAPAKSNLVFAGWADKSNNLVTSFEENETYYANWNYGSKGEINEVSHLKYFIYDNRLFDLRGNDGSFQTTFSNGGYDLYYKYTTESGTNVAQSYLTFNATNATFKANNHGLYVTPVFSFSDSKGNISENVENNLFVKVTYILQNRGSETLKNVGISSTTDVQIGSNDRAPIYGYSLDQTPVTAENKDEFTTVPNVEMHDGSGNIFSLSLSDNGDCWWGHYSSRTTYAFSGHAASDYSTGYDSGIAYSWQDMNIAPGETIERSVTFAAGDIHLFRKHDYNEYGICYGGSDCELAVDHAESPIIYQPPIYYANKYEVRNAGQLMWLANRINNGALSKSTSIKLMSNIEFPDDENIVWTPFESYSG